MSLQAHLTEVAPARSPLYVALRRATFRIRFVRFVRFCSVGLSVGGWSGLLLMIGSKLHLWPSAFWLPWAVLALGVLGGALVALIPPLPLLRVAQLTEQRAQLKERLSSAIALQSSAKTTTEFYSALWADAERHVVGLDLRTLYPVRLPRSLLLGSLACLLLIAFTFLPSLPLFWPQQKKAEMAEMRKEGLQIVHLAQQAEREAAKKHLPVTKQVAEELKKLGQKMREGKLDKPHALVAMHKLTQRLAEQQRHQAEQKKAAMQQAAQQLKPSLKQLEQQIALRRQALQSLQRQQKPAQRLQNSAKASNPKSSNVKQADARKMAQLQKELASLQKLQQALQAIQQALQSQNASALQQAMQQVAQVAQQAQGNPQMAQQLAQQLQQLAQVMQQANLKLTAQQLAQIAQMLRQMDHLSPQQLAQINAMWAKIMGICMGECQSAGFNINLLDQKALLALLTACQGKMGALPFLFSLPGFGSKPGGFQGFAMRGNHRHYAAMKDPGNTKPKLVAVGKGGKMGLGKAGFVQQFIKYLAMSRGLPGHKPNGVVPGTRSLSGNELNVPFLGEPEGGTNAATPYYQALVTSERQAESALNQEHVPVTLRQQVRAYFDSLHGEGK